jgi:glucose-6-phosphate 1-dehydrogenase
VRNWISVIGIAKSGWSSQQLQNRAKDSVEKYGGFDAEAFPKLISRLKYIDGDYSEPATFAKLRQELGVSRYPLHYLFGAHDAVNPEKKGTKATAHYLLEVPAGGSKVVRNLPVCEYDRLSRLTD